MESQKFCQSCTFPIDNMKDRGTEKDGSKSNMYCKYCYQNGAFTDPDMTLERMKEIARTEMGKQRLPDHIIQQSINMLPGLKRWQVPPTEGKV
ncbi:zinc ribbon domain-containing protein [Agriterribacter sp.]|uniref:zinc ribbon domain-containing protein n=1 Tax=Agriterribacter sp. TaxID=2821509 RepID=UPI002BD54007|nr:zinc ribbon domain-containing protein [Agriterribacter sp.]HRO47541.1 zinc ribbon domain-containing protein [Agriterribacter sp.]HRQ17000.1 zinc ribbon domain-containing protein [Agriterribacter sp.]